MNRRARRAAARGSQTRPGDPGADTPATLCETGHGHLRAGRQLDAQICCQQALTIDPAHAGSLHLMGLLALGAKQYDLAVEWISRAIRQDPKPDYLSSLGITLQHQGRLDDAVRTFGKALQLRPDDVPLWINLGSTLVRLGRPAEALLSFQEVLKLDPGHWDAANLCGILSHDAGQLTQALRYFDLCDRLRPDHAPTLRTRGVVFCKLRRYDEALADGLRAHDLRASESDPADAEACNVIGVALQL